MELIPAAKWKRQLALFSERVIVPGWNDLAQHTKIEVIDLLAQLLISTRRNSPVRTLQAQGGRDE